MATGLLAKFRDTKKYQPEDRQRYSALLVSDDPKNLDELIALSHKLDKTSADVESDRQTIHEAFSLAGRVKEARGSETALESVNSEINRHDAETRQLMSQRRSAVQPLHDRRAELIQAHLDGSQSIEQLKKLIADNPSLLAGFPVAHPNELK